VVREAGEPGSQRLAADDGVEADVLGAARIVTHPERAVCAGDESLLVLEPVRRGGVAGRPGRAAIDLS